MQPQNKRQHNFNITEPSELLVFLFSVFADRSKTNVRSLLTRRQVLVNGETETQFNRQLQVGDRVAVLHDAPSQTTNEYQGLKIIFEDEHIVVINKEAGLLSMATDDPSQDTAYSILSRHVKQQNRANKIFIVHRLDRETSGLMLFAKTPEAKQNMQQHWHNAVEERTYVAVVEGRVAQQNGSIESWLRESKAFVMHSSKTPGHGQHALTHFRVLKQNDAYSLVAVELETGRKNQIRVHMQDIGHSVVGDKKYGAKYNPINRLALHAQVLAFVHPITQQPLRFETPVPRKFEKIFEENLF